ncbi:MAG: ribose-5-phosphate isomerase RpiA [Anaerolineae bacterium]|nr:ribose-5-phosphate isomerase RpiA [Anaerolineae bacterium]
MRVSTDQTPFKQQAAEHAVLTFVRSGMVVGLGTGSTSLFAIRKLGARIQAGSLQDVVGIPSSSESAELARQAGIPLATLENHPQIDLTIDGADEMDPALNLIKGGGGALLREKMLIQASQQFVVIADASKQSSALGSHWPIPLEVIPFGWTSQVHFLEGLGGQPQQRMGADGTPYRTDQGNYILDCAFGPLEDPAKLARLLEARAGIVEHGLFLGLATCAIVAGPAGVQQIDPLRR